MSEQDRFDAQWWEEKAVTNEQLAEAAERERDKLQAFKNWVHNYLDNVGVPHHPPGTHGEHGCRIGDRMDWWVKERDEARAEIENQKAIAKAAIHLNAEKVSEIERLKVVQAKADYDYTNHKIVASYPDGSLLIDSPGGSRSRVKFVGTLEMEDEIARLRSLLERIVAAVRDSSLHYGDAPEVFDTVALAEKGVGQR